MNDAIFYFFYNFANKSALLDQIITFLAVYFPFFVVLAAAAYLLLYKSWRSFFLVFLSFGVAGILARILKELIQHSRPFFELSDIHTLFIKTTYSFPSEHAAFFGALAVAMGRENKRAGYAFLVFALLIGFARVAAGVHFPGDILGGYVLGGVIAYVVLYIHSRVAYFSKKT